MRLSKNNNILNGALSVDYAITAGSVVDGSPEDIINPDFSYFPVISGTLVRINIPARSASEPSNYFALHGVRFNNGSESKIRATLYSNGVQVDTQEIRNGTSLFYTRAESNTDWYVEFSPVGSIPSLILSVSYIASGLYSDFPRNGVRGGEYMPFYGNNISNLSTSNQLAQPVTRAVKKIAKQVNINCPNAPIEWVIDDLQDIFELYNLSGILSVQMFDDVVTASFAGYDLQDDVNVNNQSCDKLATLKLTMKSTL